MASAPSSNGPEPETGEKAADTPGVRNAGLDVVRTLAPLAETGAPSVVAQVGEAGIVDLQMDASGIRPRRDLPPIGRGEVIRRMPGGVPFPAGHFAKAVRLEGKVPCWQGALDPPFRGCCNVSALHTMKKG